MTRDSNLSDTMIEARGLTRRYGELLAVDRVDFSVRRGEVYGFLGPNGAGKSTTVRMLTGYLAPSAGTARLAGHDVVQEPTAARRCVGVVPEEANVYADLTVWQNVMLMAELHAVPRAQREARAGELLGQFGLTERRRQKGQELSKGLRQRLMLCMALVSDPAILFLDEPTSGLDVATSRLIRDIVVRENRERGTTVFLTTHNMDEAAALCQRVAIIDHGRLAVVGSPLELTRAMAARRSVEVRFAPGTDFTALMASLPAGKTVPLADGFRHFGPEPGAAAQEIATRAAARGLRIESLCTLAPSLEEVFLHFTEKREDAA
jgi:ABC-2 type transport system ATP-binding protein